MNDNFLSTKSLIYLITLTFLIPIHTSQFTYSLHKAKAIQYSSLRNLISDTTLYGSSSDLNYYYANLYLGNPPKKQAYIVDTGSSITTSPCQPFCKSCGKHLNSYYTVKDLASVIECSSSHCGMVTSRCNSNKQCEFNIKYSEGSELTGLYINETIRLGDNYLNEEGYHLPIGCTITENSLFFTQLADGIMGLSNSDKCFVTMLYNEKIISHNVFSLCLSQKGGYFSIGGVNTTYHYEKNITYIPIRKDPFYSLVLDTIHINSINITLINKKGKSKYSAIVDSGTTITYIPKKPAQKIVKEFNSYCNKEENKNKCGTYSKNKELGSCFTFDNNTHMENAIDIIWPNITFDIKGGYSYVWTPRNYFFNNTDNKPGANHIACLGFTESPGTQFLLGSTWMHGHDIIFNRGNSSLGFAQADCDKGNKEGTAIEPGSSLIKEENKCQTNNDIDIIKYIVAYGVVCSVLIGVIIYFRIAIYHLIRRESFNCIHSKGINSSNISNEVESIGEIVPQKEIELQQVSIK